MTGPVKRLLVNENCEEKINALREAYEGQMGQKVVGYLVMFIPEDRKQIFTNSRIFDNDRRMRDAQALSNCAEDWAGHVLSGGNI